MTFTFTSNGAIESSGFSIAIALHFPGKILFFRDSFIYLFSSAVVACPQNLGFFLCTNKNCISKQLECDGHDHCGDFTDEFSCSIIG